MFTIGRASIPVSHILVHGGGLLRVSFMSQLLIANVGIAACGAALATRVQQTPQSRSTLMSFEMFVEEPARIIMSYMPVAALAIYQSHKTLHDRTRVDAPA